MFEVMAHAKADETGGRDRHGKPPRRSRDCGILSDERGTPRGSRSNRRMGHASRACGVRASRGVQVDRGCGMMTKAQLAAYMADFEKSEEWAKVRAAARFSICSMWQAAERATREELAAERRRV